jgi:hypothetical protein
MKSLILPILLFSFLSMPCYANDDEKLDGNSSVTGTWSWQDKLDNEINLKTSQSGNSVHFQLDLTKSSWKNGEIFNKNFGFLDGKFLLYKNKGVFRSSEFGQCEISFVFTKSKVQIHESDYDCGFGAGVYANGTLKNLDHDEPAFSNGDPRFQ